MRLNIGAGKRRLPGYTGVDVVQRDSVDIVAEAHAIPLPDGCADEVLAVHLLEHVFEWQAPDLLREWHRLLKPGGALVLEMPDILKACRNLLEQRRIGKHVDQAHMWAIYGDQTLNDPLMMHKAGWWFDRLKPVVEGVGFVDVVERETRFHPAGRGVRDFRLEARK